MAAKFNDRLAMQALETALAEHAKELQQQTELETSRTQIQNELLEIETELEALNTKSFECSGDLSTALAIDTAVAGHETRKAELKAAHEMAKKKLRLIDNARTRISLDIPLATEAVRTARCTLAASFERWALSQSVVKEAFKILSESRATWNMALGGNLDVERWCIDTIFDCAPSQKQHDDACSLLKFPDE